ncbi:hypothetical protein GCM10010168_76220 [Actinoplanes ianthinogenes]|uniref:Transposase n=1 Tax=Actinoplanes ianthinogenes TaxID=122358 RepID=A0ABM7M9Z0_9ACTN|nr:hypothetical protein [Actinoplanes ianthinogenes]BCJ48452.1 hypothetical protein Aiant_91090 [Actinoplanes ianthinogenes]GGR46267.1 hypothetical protein GCM10010168_76220 [Actinoplanes ianthinogenes]
MSETRAVEDLCDELRRQAGTAGRVDLWVPDELTIGNAPEPKNPTGLGMAFIVDTALSLGLWPDGFTQGDGGRTYHYRA